MRSTFLIVFLLPFSAFSQGNQVNPPVQQQQVYNFTNVNEVNLDDNPTVQDNSSNTNKSNNMFVIQTTVNGPKIDLNDSGAPQVNTSSNKIPTMMFPSMGGGGGSGFATSGHSKGISIKRSILKVDKSVKRICKRHNKRKHSTSRCYAWR